MKTLLAMSRLTFELVPDSGPLAFIIYRENEGDDFETVRISDSVNVDLAEGAVLAIEIIDVNEESIATAKQFAAEHGLSLPNLLCLL